MDEFLILGGAMQARSNETGKSVSLKLFETRNKKSVAENISTHFSFDFD
jgi:hypothetical protein